MIPGGEKGRVIPKALTLLVINKLSMVVNGYQGLSIVIIQLSMVINGYQRLLMGLSMVINGYQ